MRFGAHSGKNFNRDFSPRYTTNNFHSILWEIEWWEPIASSLIDSAMGSTTSKPETKVFTPSTPIDFSSSFLSQLESSPEVCIVERFKKSRPRAWFCRWWIGWKFGSQSAFSVMDILSDVVGYQDCEKGPKPVDTRPITSQKQKKLPKQRARTKQVQFSILNMPWTTWMLSTKCYCWVHVRIVSNTSD